MHSENNLAHHPSSAVSPHAFFSLFQHSHLLLVTSPFFSWAKFYMLYIRMQYCPVKYACNTEYFWRKLSEWTFFFSWILCSDCISPHGIKIRNINLLTYKYIYIKFQIFPLRCPILNYCNNTALQLWGFTAYLLLTYLNSWFHSSGPTFITNFSLVWKKDSQLSH